MAASSVRSVRSHGTEAWAETRAELLGFVNRRVESADAAEDIVQDVLERVQRTDLAAISNVLAWLYRAARNAIVDHYRKRRGVITLEDAHERIDRVVGGRVTAEPVAAVQELARCLRPLLDELPDAYRSAVTLVDLDGSTHHAAADAAGISTSGMKSRVQRGRQRLAALVQACCAIETTATGAITDYAPLGESCSCGPASTDRDPVGRQHGRSS